MTRLFWVIPPMAAAGRLLALAGAALTVGAVLAVVGGWAYSALRHAPDWNVGLLPVVLPLQVVVAVWVAWGALVAAPRPLLRNLLVAFALSFLALYGWYFLLAGGMGPIAVGNLLYLAAVPFVAVAAMASSLAPENAPVPGAEGALRPRSGRDRAGARAYARAYARALGALTFAAVAAAAGYEVASTTAEEAGAGPSKGDLPPLSCPEYLGVEVAAFAGAGNRVSPEFEVTPMWGYEYNSWGYGTLRMTVVDKGGEAMYDEEEAPSVPVGSTGGGEYAAGGAYRLEIDADEEANYEVLVCDGAPAKRGDRGRHPQAVEPPR